MGRWWLLLPLLAGCPKSKAPERRSTEWKTAAERVAFLCDYALCPSRPDDAAFHVYPGDEGTIVHAVLKVKPDDVSRWSMGCDDLTVDPRPKWLPEVMGPTGWKVKSIPDTWRCGGEKRVIHVKEAIVIRALLRAEP